MIKAVATGCLAVAALAASIEPSLARSGIGAIFYSPSTGAYGYSDRYNSIAAANGRAQSECEKRANGAGDCALAQGFGGNCAALATVELSGKTNEGKPTVFRLSYPGVADDRDDAGSNALLNCQNNIRDATLKGLCKLVVEVCSDDH